MLPLGHITSECTHIFFEGSSLKWSNFLCHPKIPPVHLHQSALEGYLKHWEVLKPVIFSTPLTNLQWGREKMRTASFFILSKWIEYSKSQFGTVRRSDLLESLDEAHLALIFRNSRNPQLGIYQVRHCILAPLTDIACESSLPPGPHEHQTHAVPLAPLPTRRVENYYSKVEYICDLAVSRPQKRKLMTQRAMFHAWKYLQKWKSGYLHRPSPELSVGWQQRCWLA